MEQFFMDETARLRNADFGMRIGKKRFKPLLCGFASWREIFISLTPRRKELNLDVC
jgi:hypothetical protein